MKKFVVTLSVVLCAAVATWAAGTSLSISFDSPVVDCPDGNVSVAYTITSTGAADAANVTETLKDSANNVVANHAFVVASGPAGWVFAGRNKSRDATFSTTGLADGDYTLQVCATQAGSAGNPNKATCNTQPITVNCGQAELDPCANVQTDFSVGGNKDTNSPGGNAQLHIVGNFGPNALVRIEQGASFLREAIIPRDATGCGYRTAHWRLTDTNGNPDFTGNAGPGAYTVKVNGTIVGTVTLN